MRRVPIALAVAALIGAGGAAVSARQEPAATVRMRDYAFEPDRVEIRAGQAVEWVNPSPIVHTVTADPRRADDPKFVRLPEGAEPFDSGDVQPRDSFRRRFTVPGTYKYFCVPHQGMGMVGTVVVSEAPRPGD